MFISQVETLENLGFMLGRYREQRGLTVHEVAEVLHVRSKYIEAMESGNFSQLPGDAYVRGYLQNYAEFLGLSRDEVFQAFVRINEAARRQAQQFFLPKVLSRESRPSRGLAIASGVLALTFYVAWNIVQQNHLPGEAAQTIADVGDSLTADEAANQSAKPHPCLMQPTSLFPACHAEQMMPSSSPLLPVGNESQSALEVVRQLQKTSHANGS